MGSCKCKVKSFKGLGAGSVVYGLQVFLLKFFIAPSPWASFEHHQCLKLKLPHMWTRQHHHPLIFFPFYFNKKRKDEKKKDPCKVLLPPSSPSVILLLGIVLCRLQEHEVECIDLTITSRSEQNLHHPPSPFGFSIFVFAFGGSCLCWPHHCL